MDVSHVIPMDFEVTNLAFWAVLPLVTSEVSVKVVHVVVEYQVTNDVGIHQDLSDFQVLEDEMWPIDLHAGLVPLQKVEEILLG